MNPASTTFVLGYHGYDASVADAVFAGNTLLTPSENDYDWHGHGVYFWEHNALRAVFVEGNPLYTDAGFHLKSHIQICVRKISCIKGYFRPLDRSGKPPVFS